MGYMLRENKKKEKKERKKKKKKKLMSQYIMSMGYARLLG